MQYWQNDAIFEADCPECGASVEFYKDDTTRKCHGCDHRFVNPKLDFGCASYCQFAEQCLGTLPEDFLGSREDLIKDKVAVEVKRHYHTDFKSIKKTTNVARIVESLTKAEGGNMGVILCAALLHGLDKNDIAAILSKVGAAPPLIEAIESILVKTQNNSEEIKLAHDILADALTLYLYQHPSNDSDDANMIPPSTSLTLHTEAAKSLFQEIEKR